MRVESKYDQYYPDFQPRKIKFSRFHQDEQDEIVAKRLDRKPHLPTLPVSEPNNQSSHPQDLDLLIENLRSFNQKQLMELFVFRHGPQAVVKRVMSDLNGKGSDHEVMGRATGITFERLADIWIRQQEETGGDIVALDIGSCARVFKALKYATGYHLHPDGAVFSNIKSKPTLKKIYEYKANPSHPNVQPSLAGQINLMHQFRNGLAGREIDVQVTADLLRNIKFTHIKVSPKIEFLLVVPQDQDFTLPDPDITILKIPIPSSLVKQIAFICAEHLITEKASGSKSKPDF